MAATKPPFFLREQRVLRQHQFIREFSHRKLYKIVIIALSDSVHLKLL